MFKVTKTIPVLVINRTIELSHEVLILLLAYAAMETMCGYQLEEEGMKLGKRLVDLLKDIPNTSIILNDEELRILCVWVAAGCALTNSRADSATYDTLASIKEYLNNLPT